MHKYTVYVLLSQGHSNFIYSDFNETKQRMLKPLMHGASFLIETVRWSFDTTIVLILLGKKLIQRD